MQCANNVKQITLALHGVVQQNNVFPPVIADGGSQAPIKVAGPYKGAVGYTILNWLLPFMELSSLYDQAKICEVGNGGYPAVGTLPAVPQGGVWAVVGGQYIHQFSVPGYHCPDEPNPTSNGRAACTRAGGNYSGYSDYAANYYVFGNPTILVDGSSVIQGTEGAATFATITDGASNTVFIVERYGSVCGNTGTLAGGSGCLWADANGFWGPVFCYYPRDTASKTPYETPCPVFQVAPDPLNECNALRAQSPHSGGMNVGMGDGAVSFVGGSIDQTLWANLCDPRDGNTISENW